MFFELYDEDTAGWRPPGPQGRIQRHTVEQIIEIFVPVQALDVLLPQLAEQLVDVPTPSSHESSITRKKRVILARYSDATGHWFQCTGPQGSLLVAVGHRPHPADPPGGGSPPAQGGKQTLGVVPGPQILEQIVDKVVDVPVISQLKFHSPCRLTVDCASVSVHRQTLGLPVTPQRQVRTVQTVQHTGDSTVQFLIVDAFVHDAICAENPSIFRRCSSWWSTSL